MTHIKFRPTSNRELLRDSMIPNHMLNVFDNLFNESAAKFERNVFFTPRADVKENSKAFIIHVSLPGLKKEEINIDINGDVLTISGDRKFNNESNEDKYHMVESFYGKFSRSFTLPENIDSQAIDAELTDGVLKLSLPKMEVKQNKTVVTIK